MGVYPYNVLKLLRLRIVRAKQQIETTRLNLRHANNAVLDLEKTLQELETYCEPDTREVELLGGTEPRQDSMDSD